jgi:hypothetical protein
VASGPGLVQASRPCGLRDDSGREARWDRPTPGPPSAGPARMTEHGMRWHDGSDVRGPAGPASASCQSAPFRRDARPHTDTCPRPPARARLVRRWLACLSITGALRGYPGARGASTSICGRDDLPMVPGTPRQTRPIHVLSAHAPANHLGWNARQHRCKPHYGRGAPGARGVLERDAGLGDTGTLGEAVLPRISDIMRAACPSVTEPEHAPH